MSDYVISIRSQKLVVKYNTAVKLGIKPTTVTSNCPNPERVVAIIEKFIAKVADKDYAIDSSSVFDLPADVYAVLSEDITDDIVTDIYYVASQIGFNLLTLITGRIITEHFILAPRNPQEICKKLGIEYDHTPEIDAIISAFTNAN